MCGAGVVRRTRRDGQRGSTHGRGDEPQLRTGARSPHRAAGRSEATASRGRSPARSLPAGAGVVARGRRSCAAASVVEQRPAHTGLSASPAPRPKRRRRCQGRPRRSPRTPTASRTRRPTGEGVDRRSPSRSARTDGPARHCRSPTPNGPRLRRASTSSAISETPSISGAAGPTATHCRPRRSPTCLTYSANNERSSGPTQKRSPRRSSIGQSVPVSARS